MTISPLAYIDETAVINEGVIVEPFAFIGKGVVLEKGVKICSQAKVEYAHIGEGTLISTGAAIGTEPQDLGYKNEPTGVVIGKNCQIREYVTVNRASGEGNKTIVGDNCLLMTGAHVAHNVVLGNNVILANLVTLAGHVHVGDGAFIGGMVVVHQNVNIGEGTIMGGFSGTRQDIPPYAKTDGRPARIIGTNVIGLRRRGLSQDERTELKRAYKYLWFSDLSTKEAIDKIKEEITTNKYVDNLVSFIEASKRGVVKKSGKQTTEED